MTPNIGNTEKVIRVIIGIALLSLLFVLEGNMRYLGLIGVVPLVTVAVSWCPISKLLGINTCPAPQRESS